MTSLVVTVDDVATPLGMGVSEAYNVSVPAGGGSAALLAATVWGALRGLETFAQLVQVDPASGSLLIADAPVEVQDAPRFQHRGLLVDTSRHYLPVDTLLHIVDALAANKLNVMHIHFTDAQSFPVQVGLLPTARVSVVVVVIVLCSHTHLALSPPAFSRRRTLGWCLGHGAPASPTRSPI